MTVDASLVVALTLANEMIGAMGVVARCAACFLCWGDGVEFAGYTGEMKHRRCANERRPIATTQAARPCGCNVSSSDVAAASRKPSQAEGHKDCSLRCPPRIAKCCVKRTGYTVDLDGRNSQRGGIQSSACRPRRPHPRSASLMF